MSYYDSSKPAIRTAAQATQIAMRQASRAGVPTEVASVDSVKQDANGNWEAIVRTTARNYRALISSIDGAVLSWEEIWESNYSGPH